MYPFLTFVMSESKKRYSDISKYKIWVHVADHIVIHSRVNQGLEVSQGHLSLYSLSFRYISIIL